MKLPRTGRGWWRWWLDGLRCSTTARLQRRSVTQFCLEVGRQHADLVFEHKGTHDRQGALSLQDAALGSRLAELARSGKRVVIRLSQGLFLTQRVTLPGAVAANLRQVIGFEMDRITPFAADSVYYDCRIAQQRQEQNQLLVDIVLVQRARIDPWLKALADSGIKPAAVEAAGTWEGVNLLPSEQRAKAGGEQRSGISWTLAFLLLLLVAAALAGPLWQKRQQREELSGHLQATKSQSTFVIELRNRLQQRDALNRFVAEKRLQQKPTVDLLHELTLLLPDDTWLQQMEIKDGGIDIRGESRQASALIEILESSPLFESVAFRSPVVGLQAGEAEKFHIGMEVTMEGDG